MPLGLADGYGLRIELEVMRQLNGLGEEDHANVVLVGIHAVAGVGVIEHGGLVSGGCLRRRGIRSDDFDLLKVRHAVTRREHQLWRDQGSGAEALTFLVHENRFGIIVGRTTALYRRGGGPLLRLRRRLRLDRSVHGACRHEQEAYVQPSPSFVFHRALREKGTDGSACNH